MTSHLDKRAAEAIRDLGEQFDTSRAVPCAESHYRAIRVIEDMRDALVEARDQQRLAEGRAQRFRDEMEEHAEKADPTTPGNISRELLSVLRGAYARSTQGTWWRSHDMVACGKTMIALIAYMMQNPSLMRDPRDYQQPRVPEPRWRDFPPNPAQEFNDSRFIVSAHNLFPRLLDCVEALMQIADIVEVPRHGKNNAVNLTQLIERVKECSKNEDMLHTLESAAEDRRFD